MESVHRSMGSHRNAEDFYNSTLMRSADCTETWQEPPFFFEEGFDNHLAVPNVISPLDFEPSTIFDASQNPQASGWVPGPHSENAPLPGSSNSFTFQFSGSPPYQNKSQGSLQALAGEHSPLQSRESTRIGAIDPFIWEGSNPEEALLPLHLLKENFPVHFTQNSLGEYVRSADLVADVFQLVDSMQLSFEIEDLLCQCFEMSASNIRERQAARKGRNKDVLHCRKPLEESSQFSRTRSIAATKQNSQMLQKMKGKVIYYMTWAVLNGTFRLRLVSRADKSVPAVRTDLPSIHVSFIPKDYRRTKGVTVSFRRLQGDHHGYSLYRRIKTINVVPKDSDVIQCVLRNDLQSLQMLFDKREASPLDVDPQGFSLLSVSSPYSSKPWELVVLETYHRISTLCTVDAPKSTYCYYKGEQVRRIVTGQYPHLRFERHVPRVNQQPVSEAFLISCGLSGQNLRATTLLNHRHPISYPALSGISIS